MASHIPVSPWAYIRDAQFSDPVNSLRMIRTIKESKGTSIVLTRRNIQPKGGFHHALRIAPIINSNETKLIYALRHGETPHNKDSEQFNTPVAWRYLSALAKNHDPRLTPDGFNSVTRAAQYLNEETHAPRPVMVYSSPLRRCIETALRFIKEAGLQCQTPARAPPFTLHIKEGLREWMGYGHNHESDHCGSKEEIADFVQRMNHELGMNVPYILDVPELEDFHDEIYVDVDQRVRRVLDDVFDDANSGHCVMLVMHNRSHKSLLRVLGHRPEEVDKFDIENCVMLPYHVTRCMLSRERAAQRAEYELGLRDTDLQEAEEKKEERRVEAIRDVRSWARDEGNLRPRLENLFELLRNSKGLDNDPAAGLALELLEADLKGSQL